MNAGKYPLLLSPVKVGNVQFRTHTIQSPMVVNLSTADGLITERDINYMVERAKNNVGMQLLGASYITKQGHAYKYEVAVDRDECIEGLSKLADAVHDAGGNIGIQILHSGNQADPRYSGMEIVSSIDCDAPGGKARALTVEEIQTIVEEFGDAALRAKKAGLDMVEVHAAHGYLIDQFYSPLLNTRTDEYGGSLENRMRFALEVAGNIRKKVGPDYLVSFRITADDLAGDKGNTVKEACILSNRLADEAGVQIINVSVAASPVPGAGSLACICGTDCPEAVWTNLSAEIKKSLGGKALVAVANRIKKAEVAEDVLFSGKADLIVMGRALLCDPEFLTKIAEGRENEIRRCASCSYCIATMMDGNAAACMQNPMMGHEGDYDLSVAAPEKKKVVVVGGGPAGMQAAVVSARRGHDVVLMEAGDKLGGTVIAAKMPPFKYEMDTVIDNLSYEVEKYGVCVKMNTCADKEAVLAEKPDAVIVATGTVPFMPPVKGLDQPNVYTAQDVLLGKVKAEGKTVVIGGGVVGMETADFLLEQGNEITVIEMLPGLMRDLNGFQRMRFDILVIPRLAGCFVETRVMEISGDKVVTDKGTIDGVRSVVLAAGYKPVNVLADELSSCVAQVYTVGDAVKPAKIYDATHQAFAAAYKI